ncbi:MAG: C25 family cysteine peptidase [Pirellulaceae bacterium]
MIASDNPFADLDGDQIPELTIGRLAVHSRRELETVIDKIIRYESAMPQTSWRRRINDRWRESVALACSPIRSSRTQPSDSWSRVFRRAMKPR